MHTTLKAPGFALKVEYDDAYDQQPIVNGELRVDASSNNLLPNVVPLILEIAQGVKQVMQSQEGKKAPKEEEKQENKPQQRFYEDESIVTADPSAFFGTALATLVAVGPGPWTRLPFALGWVALLICLMPTRAEGDFVISADGTGLTLLALGLVVLTFALATLPRPGRR